MNAADLQKIKDAFNAWAANVENPGRKIIFDSPRAYTAAEYAAEVVNETPVGKAQIDYVEYAMQKTGMTIDEACAWINPPAKPKAP